MDKVTRFKKELAEVIQKHGFDEASRIPAHLIADHFMETLHALYGTVKAQNEWYGTWRDPMEEKEEIGLILKKRFHDLITKREEENEKTN